ncbi:MAG: site-2 protease family protein [Candidatus Aenigmatarchaeota archaeon]
MTDLLTASAFLFLLLLGILVYSDRKNIEFHYILMLRRTKKGIKLIDRIAKRNPRFWNAIGVLSIPFAFLSMVIGLSLLVWIAQAIISGAQEGPALAFVLPSFAAKEEIGLGGYAFFLPFWFYFIVVAVALIPHEFFHGVVSRAVKIPLQSAGLLLLLVFPGGFVEPDEKILKKSKPLTKLKVISAGVFANILTAFILLLFINVIFPPLVIDSIGLKIHNVTENAPAYFAGLKANMTIDEINGAKFNPSARDPFIEIVGKQNLRPGDEITVTADNQTINLVLGENPTNSSQPYMGISSYAVLTKSRYLSVDDVFAVFKYVSLLISFLLTISFVNALPWKPFDGGLALEALLEKFTKKHAEKIANGVSIIVAVLFLFVVFGSTLMKFLP